MQDLESLNFSNQFAELPEDFFHKQGWTSFENPKLIHFNEELAELLGFPKKLNPEDLMPYINGNKAFKHSTPLAMAYAGHQFGSWVPQLGDGRGILLGQIQTKHGLMDLHIKGAGKTPYSRFGDGRAVLRSTIREYLCGEAMHHLGIPSSRSLVMIGSDEPVFRETTELGAMMVRVAKTHIRFGHFEYLMHNKKSEFIPILLNHVIENYFPELKEAKDSYTDLFEKIVNATARLIAKWQAFGFAHGVMNTDNMSILGETFDFGPFGFLDDYDPGFICNHSDHQGRYAFNNQPSIGLWNCHALAAALKDHIEIERTKEIIDTYEKIFYEELIDIFRKKLGLSEIKPNDLKLVEELLTWMKINKKDYTNTFRALSKTDIHLFEDREGKLWFEKYQKRLKVEKNTSEKRKQIMEESNPKYILRNYLAQEAIQDAENSDFSKLYDLIEVLKKPYQDNKNFEDYAKVPPDWSKKLEISCSS
tara:strand:- start:362 stop:1789 length:1428 start_codon:yes stop_codon:yes gene_type:complete